MKNWHIESSS